MVEIVYHTLVPWHGDKKVATNLETGAGESCFVPLCECHVWLLRISFLGGDRFV